ncbi:hypothetical protein J3Q64DRAFT_1853632 [Phycomyces blakesleeanus]|uniref:PH domain-containing protein n=2 Tax=Phycomyces blakesleeanus TaxID=4837 RepID=A0A167JCQ3_PHYB8|nr:hypothetical protein PHYBLDRAFT_72354 [Phycomyces blakesleeanus NRRL 1555(-)]OAD65729.1 hypothetical protein PHYBLDRAFT_72354 [Phycomyces blakesleeanus NRRL 1555(-)]|eukprot:XP_018283769.1 hypothetical protein PHYBLDRAFT_72354 [Phycomyces blakesleeanus NRRL 1555(-)]
MAGSILEGWLHRMVRKTLRKSWKRCYAILSHTRLSFYKKPTDTKPLGTINLGQHNVHPHCTKRSPFAFSIESHSDRYIFYCETRLEAGMWKEACQQLHESSYQLPDDPYFTTYGSVLDKWLARLDTHSLSPPNILSSRGNTLQLRTDDPPDTFQTQNTPMSRFSSIWPFNFGKILFNKRRTTYDEVVNTIETDSGYTSL